MSVPIISALSIYQLASINEIRKVATFEKADQQTKSDVSYFMKQASKIKTPDALLKDYRSLFIVLRAFGMTGTLQQTALLRKLLTEDPILKTSVVHKLANPSYLRFANAMGQFRPPPFSIQSNVDAVLKAIGIQRFEAAQDLRSVGVSDALYFKRSIPLLTTITQLMSDPRLLKVAQAATNMPDQFGLLDYNFQLKLLKSQITMKNFQNSGYVDRFVTRYLSISSASNSNVLDTTGGLSNLQNNGSTDNILGTLLPQFSDSNPMISLFA